MSSLPLMYLRALQRYMSTGARTVRPHVDLDNAKDLFKDRTGFFAAVELVFMGVKPTDVNVEGYQQVACLSAQAGMSEDGLTSLQVRAKESANLLVEFNAMDDMEEIEQVKVTRRQLKLSGVHAGTVGTTRAEAKQERAKKRGIVQTHCRTCRAVYIGGHPYRREHPWAGRRRRGGKLARYNRSTVPRVPCQIADTHITHGPNRKRRKWWSWGIATTNPWASKRRSGGKLARYNRSTLPRIPCQIASTSPHHTRTKQEEKEAVGSDDEGRCDTCVHTNTEPHDRAHAEEQKSRKSKKCKQTKEGEVVLSDSDEGI